ncbi:MAG: co-chaperone GroES [Chloroflexi bacterium]|nr:MAG: co-chaperone GroES [Anaerolineaceae bacterium 4572_32.2]RLC80377.1 MAG: co-chaperone GroES [Chloroflexota bacterium]RLC87388.1 MAG: co-chaperone GroES [Chloroflexota bacterium]HEY72280.1 co-chaperone GroES [Thermoflexia bacterium]
MALNIKPLGDRVVVEPLEKDVETFAGGELVLPDTAKEKPQQGKILAVGAGRLDEDGDRIPMEVKVGDTVVYAKYAGTSFKGEGGKEILFLKESDILAVLG